MQRVLVVDDEAAFGASVARVLRGLAEVSHDDSGAKAMARLGAGERFDVILSDVMMPGMTGPQLYDALAAFAPELCTILTFATDGMDASTAKHMRATGRPCLQKLVTVAALRALLDQLP